MAGIGVNMDPATGVVEMQFLTTSATHPKNPGLRTQAYSSCLHPAVLGRVVS